MNGKHLGMAFVFAAGLATSLSAAQGTTQKAPPLKPSQTKGSTKNPATITGCLERNATTVDRSTVEPPGDPGLPAYKLTHVDANVLKDVLDASKASGTTGEQQTATSIWVRAEGKTDLAAHVGHKVELIGKVVTETKNDEPPATSASSAAAAKRGVADHLPTFQVNNVKMIASSCQ